MIGFKLSSPAPAVGTPVARRASLASFVTRASFTTVAAFAVGACATGASASFVGYFVSSTSTSYAGQDLVVYTLTARFSSPHVAVLRASNLLAGDSDWLSGFWHKDNHGDPATNGRLSQQFGTWDPTKTGSGSVNRPYDSYLTIGGSAGAGNTTQADANWLDGGSGPSTRGWSRPDLPDNGTLGWFNDDDDNEQGSVGSSPGVANTDVRLGQFVLSAGHEARTFSLTIKYGNEYSFSDKYEYATDSFTLGAVPAPGALVLLGLAGLLGGRRRRSNVA